MRPVVIIGPVTWDRVVLGDGSASRRPGGVPFYAGLALAALRRGAPDPPLVAVTRLADRDRADLLGPLASAGIAVVARSAPRTTVFVNRYAADDPDAREQRLEADAGAFDRADLEAAGDLTGRAVLLGPLLPGDIDAAGLGYLAARAELVALDAQGFVREHTGGCIAAADWPWAAQGLAAVDIVKASGDEAARLTGAADPLEAARRLAARGPSQVLVTLGKAGAVVASGSQVWTVPAAPLPAGVDPARLDPTGCGDTFLAAYLHAHLAGASPPDAAAFAGRAAAAKLARPGPLRAHPDRLDPAPPRPDTER